MSSPGRGTVDVSIVIPPAELIIHRTPSADVSTPVVRRLGRAEPKVAA